MINWLNKFFKKKIGNFFLGEEHDVLIEEFKKNDVLGVLENWKTAGAKFEQQHMIVWLDEIREVYFPEFTTIRNEKEILSFNGENCLFLIKTFSLNKNLNDQISSNKRINL